MGRDHQAKGFSESHVECLRPAPRRDVVQAGRLSRLEAGYSHRFTPDFHVRSCELAKIHEIKILLCLLSEIRADISCVNGEARNEEARSETDACQIYHRPLSSMVMLMIDL